MADPQAGVWVAVCTIIEQDELIAPPIEVNL